MLSHKEIAALSDAELVREFERAVRSYAEPSIDPWRTKFSATAVSFIDRLRNALDARLAAGRKPRPVRVIDGVDENMRLWTLKEAIGEKHDR